MATYKGRDYAEWARDTFDWTNITPRLELIDVNTLFAAAPFQRDLDEERAAGMAHVLLPPCADGVKIGVLPDGRRFKVDGQHRLRAAQLAGQPTLWALVYDFPTYAQMAAMFHICDGDGVVKTTPKAALNAAKESGRPREEHIFAILADFGLSFKPTEDAKTVEAARIMGSIYDVDGGDLLALTLEVVTECWGTDYYKLEGRRNRIPVVNDVVLEGTALFLAHHAQMAQSPFLLRELKRSLGKRDLGDLVSKATDAWVGTDHKPKLAFHVEREMVATFNHGRSSTGNRLPDRTARDFMKLGFLRSLHRAPTPNEDEEGA